jgi:hypothetical protein
VGDGLAKKGPRIQHGAAILGCVSNISQRNDTNDSINEPESGPVGTKHGAVVVAKSGGCIISRSETALAQFDGGSRENHIADLLLVTGIPAGTLISGRRDLHSLF